MEKKIVFTREEAVQIMCAMIQKDLIEFPRQGGVSADFNSKDRTDDEVLQTRIDQLRKVMAMLTAAPEKRE